MSRALGVSVMLLVVFAAVGAVLTVVFSSFLTTGTGEFLPPLLVPRSGEIAAYAPPRPQAAPETMVPAVMQGYRLMLGDEPPLTRQASQPICQDCHFEGGRTPGGRNGGISVVGAGAKYPQPGPNGRMMSVARRINRCVVVNMNAPALPEDSSEMTALIAYVQWMSAGVPVYGPTPWRGVGRLVGEQPPSKENGAAVHQQYCAVCHGPDGQGTPIAPAQWGPRSFTRSSELAAQAALASFVHLNMPRENPLLSVQQARDVAAYLLSQPRPAAQTQEGD